MDRAAVEPLRSTGGGAQLRQIQTPVRRQGLRAIVEGGQRIIERAGREAQSLSTLGESDNPIGRRGLSRAGSGADGRKVEAGTESRHVPGQRGHPDAGGGARQIELRPALAGKLGQGWPGERDLDLIVRREAFEQQQVARIAFAEHAADPATVNVTLALPSSAGGEGCGLRCGESRQGSKEQWCENPNGAIHTKNLQ